MSYSLKSGPKWGISCTWPHNSRLVTVLTSLCSFSRFSAAASHQDLRNGQTVATADRWWRCANYRKLTRCSPMSSNCETWSGCAEFLNFSLRCGCQEGSDLQYLSSEDSLSGRVMSSKATQTVRKRANREAFQKTGWSMSASRSKTWSIDASSMSLQGTKWTSKTTRTSRPTKIAMRTMKTWMSLHKYAGAKWSSATATLQTKVSRYKLS